MQRGDVCDCADGMCARTENMDCDASWHLCWVGRCDKGGWRKRERERERERERGSCTSACPRTCCNNRVAVLQVVPSGQRRFDWDCPVAVLRRVPQNGGRPVRADACGTFWCARSARRSHFVHVLPLCGGASAEGVSGDECAQPGHAEVLGPSRGLACSLQRDAHGACLPTCAVVAGPR